MFLALVVFLLFQAIIEKACQQKNDFSVNDTLVVCCCPGSIRCEPTRWVVVRGSTLQLVDLGLIFLSSHTTYSQCPSLALSTKEMM